MGIVLRMKWGQHQIAMHRVLTMQSPLLQELRHYPKNGLNLGAIEGTINCDRLTADDAKLASNSCANEDDAKLAATNEEKKSGVVPFTPM